MTRSISFCAADDRVELALAGEFGQIAAEAIQGRRLGLAFAGAVALRRRRRPPLSSWHVVPQQVKDFFADVFQLQPEIHQHLGGHALLLAKKPEQQVFRADVVVIEIPRFFDGVLDHLLARGVWATSPS